MQVLIDCHGHSAVGRVRDVNEDQFLIADLARTLSVEQTSLPVDEQARRIAAMQGKLLVVADGMGGHASGQRASTLAIEAIAHYALEALPWILELDQHLDSSFREQLQRALVRAEAAIEGDAAGAPEREGMGTTLTMAYVLWPHLYVVHVGDSRCYLLRGGQLQQLTRDHTVAQQMVDQGRLAPEDVESSEYAHVLWNAIVAVPSKLAPEVYSAELCHGDSLLLCSDGLTKHVPQQAVTEFLGSARDAAHACQLLINRANEGGGSDNTTVVVARFLQPATQPLRMRLTNA